MDVVYIGDEKVFFTKNKVYTVYFELRGLDDDIYYNIINDEGVIVYEDKSLFILLDVYREMKIDFVL